MTALDWWLAVLVAFLAGGAFGVIFTLMFVMTRRDDIGRKPFTRPGDESEVEAWDSARPWLTPAEGRREVGYCQIPTEQPGDWCALVDGHPGDCIPVLASGVGGGS